VTLRYFRVIRWSVNDIMVFLGENYLKKLNFELKIIIYSLRYFRVIRWSVNDIMVFLGENYLKKLNFELKIIIYFFIYHNSGKIGIMLC